MNPLRQTSPLAVRQAVGLKTRWIRLPALVHEDHQRAARSQVGGRQGNWAPSPATTA
jgi:hypothetical protein